MGTTPGLAEGKSGLHAQKKGKDEHIVLADAPGYPE
jgi:hypothetical protein